MPDLGHFSSLLSVYGFASILPTLQLDKISVGSKTGQKNTELRNFLMRFHPLRRTSRENKGEWKEATPNQRLSFRLISETIFLEEN